MNSAMENYLNHPHECPQILVILFGKHLYSLQQQFVTGKYSVLLTLFFFFVNCFVLALSKLNQICS